MVVWGFSPPTTNLKNSDKHTMSKQITISKTLSYKIAVSYIVSGDGNEYYKDCLEEADQLQMAFPEKNNFVKHHLRLRSTYLN